MTEENEERKITIDINIIKPKNIEVTQAELETVLKTTIEFFRFHFNLILAQKSKNPNEKLN